MWWRGISYTIHQQAYKIILKLVIPRVPHLLLASPFFQATLLLLSLLFLIHCLFLLLQSPCIVLIVHLVRDLLVGPHEMEVVLAQFLSVCLFLWLLLLLLCIVIFIIVIGCVWLVVGYSKHIREPGVEFGKVGCHFFFVLFPVLG